MNERDNEGDYINIECIAETSIPMGCSHALRIIVGKTL